MQTHMPRSDFEHTAEKVQLNRILKASDLPEVCKCNVQLTWPVCSCPSEAGFGWSQHLHQVGGSCYSFLGRGGWNSLLEAAASSAFSFPRYKWLEVALWAGDRVGLVTAGLPPWRSVPTLTIL